MPFPALYLVVQSILAAAWWALLLLRPEARAWFRPADGPDVMLLAFWLADLVCVVAGSAAAAALVHRRHARRVVALAFTCGAMVYATLYCAALSLLSDEAWLGVILMLPATCATLVITWHESRG